MSETNGNVERYIKLALDMGAEHAVAVSPDALAFDGRTLLKCMFGCDDWGKGPTCPSRGGFLKPWEFEPLLRRYKTIIIVHAHDKHTTQRASFEIERQAFLDGDALSFSMSDCGWCAKCAGAEGKACYNPKKARPALHSAGIDIFTTAKSLGLPIYTLKEETEEQNWYAGAFVNF